MSTYGYGPPPPPPPPPPPTQPPSSYGQYQPAYQGAPQHGRGGRGGGHHSGGRGGGSGGNGGGEYQAPAGYAYGSQPGPAYGQQPAHYGGAPQHGSYAPPQQQWAHDPAAHSLSQQQQSSHNPFSPQAYPPSYMPQVYPPPHQPGQSAHHPVPPPPASYGQQPPYVQAGGQPPYGPPYTQAGQPPNVPPPQQWGPPAPSYSGRGRGGGSNGSASGGSGSGSNGGGHHHERGGKTQMMGPPIRIGFENGSPQGAGHVAPVSNTYPQLASYRHAQGSSAPSARPSGYASGSYQAYPPPGSAAAAGPAPYEPYYGQNSRHYGRGGGGGYHGSSYRGGRGGFGGDKMRHRRPNGGLNKGYPPAYHQKPDAAFAGKKKKRKTNTLGLTPGEESEEEDVDEEAKLVEMIGPDAPNPTDIAAWVEQRRKNFPTRERVAAKLAVQEEGDKEAAAGGGEEATTEPAANGKEGTVLTALERQQQKAEKLRRQLEKVESSIKRKREQQDEGDEMRDGDDSSDLSSDSKSDDEAPESLPIKSSVPAAAPTAPRRADHSKHCKYYSTGGTCGKKGKCRFVHDPAVREAALRERELNGGRMTLQQRLILNDKDQEDLTIVKTLQYLKDKGMMKDCVAGPAKPAAASTVAASTAKSQPDGLPAPPAQPAEKSGEDVRPPASSLLPPAPPSAVSSTPTMPYQGWNLSGFGNTGVKSGDL